MFGNQKEIEELRKRIRELERLNSKTSDELVVQRQKNSNLQDTVNDLKKQVRDQTKADLLFNALEAVGVVKSEKPDTDHFARAASLQNQLNRMQTPAGLGKLSGLIGGAGSLF